MVNPSVPREGRHNERRHDGKAEDADRIPVGFQRLPKLRKQLRLTQEGRQPFAPRRISDDLASRLLRLDTHAYDELEEQDRRPSAASFSGGGTLSQTSQESSLTTTQKTLRKTRGPESRRTSVRSHSSSIEGRKQQVEITSQSSVQDGQPVVVRLSSLDTQRSSTTVSPPKDRSPPQSSHPHHRSQPVPKLVLRLSTWMSNPIIRACRFWDICLPGTHNSASWQLADDSDRRWGGVVFAFLKQYIHCQEMNVYHQLLLGARFLDLRVCKHLKRQGEPFCAHGGFRTISFKDVLQQVARFAHSHPTEVIVLSVRRDVAYMYGRASIGIIESDFWVAFYLKDFLGPRLTSDITIGELADRKQNVLYFFEERERYIPPVGSLSPERIDAFVPPPLPAHASTAQRSPTILRQTADEFLSGGEVLAHKTSERRASQPSNLTSPRRTVVGTLLPVKATTRGRSARMVLEGREKSELGYHRTSESTAGDLDTREPSELSVSLEGSRAVSEEEDEEPVRFRRMFTAWIKSNMEKYAIDKVLEEEKRKPLRRRRDSKPKRVTPKASDTSKRRSVSKKRRQRDDARRLRRHHSFPKPANFQGVSRRRLSVAVTTAAVQEGRQDLQEKHVCRSESPMYRRSDSLPFLPGREREIRQVERELGNRHRKSIEASRREEQRRRSSLADASSNNNEPLSPKTRRRFSHRLRRFGSRQQKGQSGFGTRRRPSRFLNLERFKTQRCRPVNEDSGAASDRSGITAVHAANAVKRLLSQSATRGSVASWQSPEMEWLKTSKRKQRQIVERPVYSDPEMRVLKTTATRWKKAQAPVIAGTVWSDGERECALETTVNATQQTTTTAAVPPAAPLGLRTRTVSVTSVPPNFRSSFHGPHVRSGNRVSRLGGSRTAGTRRRRSLFAPTLDCLSSQLASDDGHLDVSPRTSSTQDSSFQKRPTVLQEAESAAVGARRSQHSRRTIKMTGRPSLLTPFVAGKTRIIKSWTITCDPNPKLLCKKLQYWSLTHGTPRPRQPFVLRILAGAFRLSFEVLDSSRSISAGHAKERLAACCS